MKKIRILSLDGGGIRGILPGTILTYIEQRLREETGNTNASIGQYFDFLAGTSTGGILSLIYACPDENGNYKFTAKQALDLYCQKGGNIFELTLGRKIRTLGGLTDEKYSAQAIEQELYTYFGNTRLSQALKPCLISSYDIEKRQAKFFTSSDALANNDDFEFRDVARATSAAPTYFEPAHILSTTQKPYALIDGGVFVNNPALCAYAEARTTNFAEVLNDPKKPTMPTAGQMLIVSIGTGSVKKSYPFDDFKDAGMARWIKPLIDIMMSGNAETVDYQLKQIFGTLKPKDNADYYRIEPILDKADPEMDNAEQENLDKLYAAGQASVALYKDQLDDIVTKLIENH